MKAIHRIIWYCTYRMGSPLYELVHKFLCNRGFHSWGYYPSGGIWTHKKNEPCNCDRRECPYCETIEKIEKKT